MGFWIVLWIALLSYAIYKYGWSKSVSTPLVSPLDGVCRQTGEESHFNSVELPTCEQYLEYKNSGTVKQGSDAGERVGTHVRSITKVSCETPKGYLECKAYKKEITWEQYKVMYAIAMAESRFRPNATNVNKNGSIDRGIFQVNDKFHPKLTNDLAFSFKENIDYAIKLMKRSGFTPWSAFKNGSYVKFLAEAE